MKKVEVIFNKIFTLENLKKQIASWRATGKTIAFTNGCFDIVHVGHIYSLQKAASQADVLIVGLNSDDSVKRQGKSPERPINKELDRANILANFIMVDAVVIFDEDTPFDLITNILPDVLVKGGDYTIDNIVGAKEVIADGGKVVINEIVEGYSTTGLIGKLAQS